MLEKLPDRPRVVAFPPLLYGGTLAVGLIAHVIVPVQPLPALASRILGVLLLVFSGALARWAEGTMHREGTNVNPRQPTLALVIDGPFRLTRNPLYIDRKSTRLNSSHSRASRMPSSA